MENNTSNQVIEERQENKKVTTSVIIGVIGALILGAVAYFFVTNQSKNNSQTDTQIKTYSFEEVAKNNSKSSCWTVIDNNVYNVTDFVLKHKGGDKILAVCGIDGTDLFTGKSPLGRVHSDMAKAVLSKMQIGKLQ